MFRGLTLHEVAELRGPLAYRKMMGDALSSEEAERLSLLNEELENRLGFSKEKSEGALLLEQLLEETRRLLGESK